MTFGPILAAFALWGLAMLVVWLVYPTGRTSHGCVRCAQGMCRDHGVKR